MARLSPVRKPQDYAAFERVLTKPHERCPIRLPACCLMPDHWHMVLWPQEDGELTGVIRWLTHTRAMWWHTHHHTAGTDPLYQERFKSFPVRSDEHFLTVCRCVKRKTLCANRAERAGD